MYNMLLIDAVIAPKKPLQHRRQEDSESPLIITSRVSRSRHGSVPALPLCSCSGGRPHEPKRLSVDATLSCGTSASEALCGISAPISTASVWRSLAAVRCAPSTCAIRVRAFWSVPTRSRCRIQGCGCHAKWLEPPAATDTTADALCRCNASLSIAALGAPLAVCCIFCHATREHAQSVTILMTGMLLCILPTISGLVFLMRTLHLAPNPCKCKGRLTHCSINSGA